MTEGLHFYLVTPAEFRRIEAAAKAAGVLTAEWVGRAAVSVLTRVDTPPEHVIG